MEWTTTNENGEIETLPSGGQLSASYERLEWLENFTDYEFTTTQKAQAIASGVKDEAVKTASSVGAVFDNIGAGISNASLLIKIAPFVIGAYYLYQMTERKGALFGK